MSTLTPPAATAIAPAAAAAADPAGPPPAARKPYLTLRPTRGWTALNLRETWRARDLLWSLAARDLKLRYKQTALGVVWVVLQPLVTAGVFSFVFGTLFHAPGEGVPNFLLCYAGQLGWTLFANTLGKTSTCLVGNAQLISKVFFPRLVLPLSTIPSVLVDFGVALAMMAVMMAACHVRPGPAVLLLPVWMALLLALALGVGLSAAALAVSYRDVQQVLPVATQTLLYASPVGYSLAFALGRLGPGLRTAYLLNPLAAPLEAFRWSLLGTPAPPAWPLAVAGLTSVAACVAGAFNFKRMERRFADVI